MKTSLLIVCLFLVGCSSTDNKKHYPVDVFVDPVTEVDPFVGVK
jgi:uncharacterized lipoprotein YmbA